MKAVDEVFRFPDLRPEVLLPCQVNVLYSYTLMMDSELQLFIHLLNTAVTNQSSTLNSVKVLYGWLRALSSLFTAYWSPIRTYQVLRRFRTHKQPHHKEAQGKDEISPARGLRTAED